MGAPAFSQMGRPKDRLFIPSFWATCWDPHTASGTSGAPEARAIRPTPVFPCIGVKSGFRVMVASG
jgi:hypothetical protein